MRAERSRGVAIRVRNAASEGLDEEGQQNGSPSVIGLPKTHGDLYVITRRLPFRHAKPSHPPFMSLPTPLAPTTSYFLGIPPADGRYRHPPDSPPSSVYRGSHRGLSPLGRHRPLATSQESLIPVGPTRSFSMPLHDYASSTGSLNNFGLSPAPSSRPLYVRGATTINNITGLNVMSDDEREKRALQSAISQTGTDGSSAQGPGASRRKADSAEWVFPHRSPIVFPDTHL